MVQVGGDDAELRLQIEDVPAALAEDEDGGRSVLVTHRPVIVREQADERRLAGAVGTDDRGVLARGDGEREAVEDAAVIFDDRRVSELEDWIRQSGKV